MTPGRKNCLFIGAPEEEHKRCKVGGLAALTWIPGKLPGYRSGDHVVYGDSGYLGGGETGCGEG